MNSFPRKEILFDESGLSLKKLCSLFLFFVCLFFYFIFSIMNESIPKDEADQLLQDLFHEMSKFIGVCSQIYGKCEFCQAFAPSFNSVSPMCNG